MLGMDLNPVCENLEQFLKTDLVQPTRNTTWKIMNIVGGMSMTSTSLKIGATNYVETEENLIQKRENTVQSNRRQKSVHRPQYNNNQVKLELLENCLT